NQLKTFPAEIENEIRDLLLSLVDVNSMKVEIFDKNISTLAMIQDKIRDFTFEPIAYLNVKRISSFNQQMKNMWKIVELTFILVLSYHLNIYEEFTKKDTTGQKSQMALELVGKKLNHLLSWMSNRVQVMKDTFDALRNYLQ